MANNQLIAYILSWILIGALLFSVFVVIVFRSGLVYTARKLDGTLKEKVPLRGLAVMGGFLLLVLGYFLAGNYIGLTHFGNLGSFGFLFIINLLVYLILFTYDTLVIDGLVLVYWRPAFLKLPQEMGHESMRKHIVKSLPVGLVFGIVLSGITAGLSWSLFTD